MVLLLSLSIFWVLWFTSWRWRRCIHYFCSMQNNRIKTIINTDKNLLYRIHFFVVNVAELNSAGLRSRIGPQYLFSLPILIKPLSVSVSLWFWGLSFTRRWRRCMHSFCMMMQKIELNLWYWYENNFAFFMFYFMFQMCRP